MQKILERFLEMTHQGVLEMKKTFVCLSGRTANMVYADSLYATSGEGVRFSANPGYPNAKADVEGSIATVESLRCDVLVAAHPEPSGLWERKAKQPARGNAAFIDGDGCRKYAAKARARLARTLAGDAAAAQTGMAAK